MAKPSKDISILRGERVKALLKKFGWTQAQLASELGISEPVLNAKLNGKRTLTEEDAKAIAKIYQPVSVGWIMGVERYPTPIIEFKEKAEEANQEARLLNMGIYGFASLIGYSITPPPMPDSGPVQDVLSAIKQGYTLSKDGKTVSLSLDEYYRFLNKICDLVEIELKYMFKDKEG